MGKIRQSGLTKGKQASVGGKRHDDQVSPYVPSGNHERNMHSRRLGPLTADIAHAAAYTDKH